MKLFNIDTIIGYVLHHNGDYDYKYQFRNTPENLMSFLNVYQYQGTVILTDDEGNKLVEIKNKVITASENCNKEIIGLINAFNDGMIDHTPLHFQLIDQMYQVAEVIE